MLVKGGRMPEIPIDFNQLKGRIEKDEDWREGVNAFRKWTDAELQKLQQDVHDIKVFMKRYQVSVDYIEAWKKRQDMEESKIQGEKL